ncbi:hypothetical protein TBLA_0H02670 [Henningerozyma blattae CBS 6284]|uniref:Peroxisome assembly protein 12 n=1 Tax=Henningerozyma blattae (strain ATCC 34711 / CBS 6284 / DSM 70876 / NBRC 10599 / NRRL Y-10934 / UCD 77-7) TaxID=1071380 RepID=I2H849_HENB6|nr:hypothetical protein TBLA_0H02670 [Tetrapisispora blattae CBS 6284]CCH62551.1 hypothetical protein TBLA_0H02670 [Tetrapisispora blattae CBS 6284]
MSYLSNLPINQVTLASIYPTIFEIVSTQEVDDLLPSSIRYLLTNYWISRYPSRLSIGINNYFEEWFNLIIKGLVEYYHIKYYNTTFVDKFYGLQRFNSKSNPLLNAHTAAINNVESTSAWAQKWPLGLQLTKKQRLVVFLQKIIFPYLKNKLDQLYIKLIARNSFGSSLPRNGDTSQNIINNLKKRLFKIFQLIYPILTKIFNSVDILLKLSYLTKRTGYFSLLDYLFSIEYTRLQFPLEKEIDSYTLNFDKSHKLKNRMENQNYYSALDYWNSKLSGLLGITSFIGSQIFPSFIFLLRVYQWWTTENISVKIEKRIKGFDKDIPNPSRVSVSIKDEGEKRRDRSKCPVCQDTIRNPCILETGCVMCYPCAIKYIPEHEGKCPVTDRKLLGCIFDKQSSEWKIVSGIRRLMI